MCTSEGRNDWTLSPSSVRALRTLVYQTDSPWLPQEPDSGHGAIDDAIPDGELWAPAMMAAQAIGMWCWGAVAVVLSADYGGIHKELVAPVLCEWDRQIRIHRKEFAKPMTHGAVIDFYRYCMHHREEPEASLLLDALRSYEAAEPVSGAAVSVFRSKGVHRAGFHLSGLFRALFRDDPIAWQIIRDLARREHSISCLARDRHWNLAECREADPLAGFFADCEFDCLLAVRGKPQGCRTAIEREFVHELCLRHDPCAFGVVLQRDRDNPFYVLVMDELRRAIGKRLDVHLLPLRAARRDPAVDHARTPTADLAEDCFVKGVQAIQRYSRRNEFADARAFAYIVGDTLGKEASVRLGEQRRQRPRVVPFTDEVHAAAAEGRMQTDNLGSLVDRASLTDREWVIVYRHVVRKERYTTIAKSLGITAKRCARLNQGAMIKLRAEYRHSQGE